jgi:hypothetical protein
VVDSDAQLFTIEGIAAALIMLATVFIVVNTTSVYSPGDTHINDMQLEVIGADALKTMNIADSSSAGKSPLVDIVEKRDASAFNDSFYNILNNRTDGKQDDIQFTANITYVANWGAIKGQVNSTHFSNSSRGILYGGEHAVHVSQWIIVDNYNRTAIPATAYNVFPEQCGGGSIDCSGKHAALVEVLLWRD